MLLGEGVLKDWLKSKCIESKLSGTDIPRNPEIN
jgi:hypothetical protein